MNSNTLTPAERLAASFAQNNRRFQEMLPLANPPQVPIQPAHMAFPLPTMILQNSQQVTSCLFCNHQCHTQEQLTQHLQIEHSALLPQAASQPTQRRSSFSCNLCGTLCDTQEQLLTHYAGQKHRRKAQWHAAFCVESQQFNSQYIVEDSPGIWNCNACAIPLIGENSVLQHIRSGKHSRQRDALATARGGKGMSNNSELSSSHSDSDNNSKSSPTTSATSSQYDNNSRPNGAQQSSTTLRSPTGIAKTKNSVQVSATSKKNKNGISLPSFDCGVCNVSCNSMETLNAHLSSAKHKRKLRNAETPNHSNATQKNSSDVNILCDVCNVSICGKENFDMHVRGRMHQRRAKGNGLQNQDCKNNISDYTEKNTTAYSAEDKQNPKNKKEVLERKGVRKGSHVREMNDNKTAHILNVPFSNGTQAQRTITPDLMAANAAINSSFQMPLTSLPLLQPMNSLSQQIPGFPNMMQLSSLSPNSMITPYPPSAMMSQQGASSQPSLNHPVSQQKMLQPGLQLPPMSQPVPQMSRFASMGAMDQNQGFTSLLPANNSLQFPQPSRASNTSFFQQAAEEMPPKSDSGPLQSAAPRHLTEEQQKQVMQLLQKVAEHTKKMPPNSRNNQ